MTPLRTLAPDAPAWPGVRAQLQPAAQGWMRELQKRAHAQSWFPAPLLSASQALIRASEPAATLPAGRVAAGPACGLPSRSARPQAAPAPRGSCSVGSDAHLQAPSLESEGAGATEPSADSPAPLVHQSRPIASPAAAPAMVNRRTVPVPDLGFISRRDAPGVRVHVEQGDAGLHVWLGVDARDPVLASPATSLLAAVLAGAAAAPHRLATVVCNGTTVYPSLPADSSLPSQEQPWPSAH